MRLLLDNLALKSHSSTMDLKLVTFSVFLAIATCTNGVLSQSASCSGFEIDSGWKAENATVWYLSNDVSPSFVSEHDSGFIWSKYATGSNKPVIASPVMAGILPSTTFSLQFSAASSRNSIYISFRRLSSKTMQQIAIPKGKDNYGWTTFSANCTPQSGISCCGSDTESCSGQFIVGAGQINAGDEVAFDAFSTNGGKCADIQNPECSTFDDKGDWSLINGWILSKNYPPDQVIPVPGSNYVWSDYTKSADTNNIPELWSPIIGVAASTKYSFDYFLSVNSGNFSLVFQKQSSGTSENVTLSSEIVNPVDESWLHLVADCNRTNAENYCCGGAEKDTCYGQFIIVGTGMDSGSVLAIDNFSINGACESTQTTTGTPDTTIAPNTGSEVTTTAILETTTPGKGTVIVPEVAILLTLMMTLALRAIF